MPPPGTTAIEEAVVTVPDERVDWLASLHNSKKITHAAIHCLDVPGFHFADEHGSYSAGCWLRFPPGARHRPRSAGGCTLYAKRGGLVYLRSAA